MGVIPQSKRSNFEKCSLLTTDDTDRTIVE